MDPAVISDTIQEFDGVRWYRCGRYFRRNGALLHRAVWANANGPIPDGFHIHHRNGDRFDNRLSNLQAVDASTHTSRHASERTPARERAWAAAADQLAAGNARLTTAQRADAGRRGWQRRVDETDPERMDCQQCGSSFTTHATHRQTRFCSNACKSAARRASGVDDEKRACDWCGTPFTVNRYESARHCSRSCAGRTSRAHRQS